MASRTKPVQRSGHEVLPGFDAMPSFRSCGAAETELLHCTVPLWGAWMLLEGAVAAGCPPAELLRRLGAPATGEPDPQQRIRLDRLGQTLRWVCRRRRDELVGLWRKPVPIGSFALVLRQMCQCATLGAALRLGLRLYGLLAPGFPLRLRRDGGLVWLEVPAGEGRNLGFAVSCVYWAFSTLRWLAERPIPVRLAAVAADGSDARYREPQPFFEVEARYRSPTTGVAFDIGWLNRPIARSADDARRLLEAAPGILLRNTEPRRSVVQQVRSQLLQQLRAQPQAGMPNLEAVASRLAMSPRGLRRRLKAEGGSFLALREDCLRELSVQWVAHTELSLADVGMRLGFSESSTFHRAFKRWTGLPPGEFRRTAARGQGVCAPLTTA